jgi:hypothetical protein
MAWKNPRPEDFSPEALRAIFRSLETFLANPEFSNGVALGSGVGPTYDDTTGVTTPEPTTDVTGETVAVFTADALESDNYDGTSVAAGDATTGWRIERGTGGAEFGDARIRGDITAERLRTVPGADIVPNGSFGSNTTGWSLTQAGAYGIVLSWDSSAGDVAAGSLKMVKPNNAIVVDVAGQAYVRSDLIPVDPLRAYLCTHSHDETGLGMVMSFPIIEWYDSTSTFISETEVPYAQGVAVEDLVGLNGFFREQFGSVSAPSNAAYCKIRFNVYDTVGNGGTLWLDNITLTEAPSVVGGHIQSRPVAPYVALPSDSGVVLQPDGRAASIQAATVRADYNNGGAAEDDYTTLFLTSGRPMSDPTAPTSVNASIQMDSSSEDGLTPSRITLGTDELVHSGTGIDVLGPWLDYTPSNTGITIGNGTQVAKYIVIGKTCHVRWRLTFGSTTAITANARVGLPFAAADTCSLDGKYVGTRTWIGGLVVGVGGTDGPLCHTESGNNGRLNATNPTTFGTGDFLVISGSYEIA